MVLPPDTFSVIDLASAFNQLFLDDESYELLTINTRKGLFRSKRLCFGSVTKSLGSPITMFANLMIPAVNF